jgi:hypothetical protein
MAQGEMLNRDIINPMRHYGCGGRPAFAELLTSRPVRRIVLIERTDR